MKNNMTLELLIKTVRDESSIFMYDIDKKVDEIIMVKDFSRLGIIPCRWIVKDIKSGHNNILVVTIEKN